MTSIQELIDDIDFDIDRSVRYHQRRRQFYDGLHKGLMFFVIIFGSSSFASLLNEPEYFGAAAAVLGAIDLVFNLSHRARDHEILYRRFNELLAEVREKDPSDELIFRWTRRRLDIEADEPPVYHALEAQCYNEAVRARGWETANPLVKIRFDQKVLMNWRTYSNSDFGYKIVMAAQPCDASQSH